MVLARPAAAQGDADRGREVAYTCRGCHGIPGYRNAYPSFRVPKLAGQKPEYLKAALHAYRSGTRKHPTMQAQGSSLTDQDIDDVVAWISSTGTTSDELDTETAGLPDVAKTCVSCHGTAGKEATPAPPILSGQQPSYIEHALSLYKATARGNTVMNSFAATLGPEDIERVATFFSSREGLEVLGQDE